MRTAAQELAMSTYARGAHREAISLFQKALAESENAECWNDLGCAQFACEMYTEAEASFRRSLALQVDYGQAKLNLGALLARRGRRSEALPLLTECLAAPTLGAQDRAQIAPLVEECLSSARKLTEPPFAHDLCPASVRYMAPGFFENGLTEANAREAWTLFSALQTAGGNFKTDFVSLESAAAQPIYDAARSIVGIAASDVPAYMQEHPVELLHVFSPMIPWPLNHGVERQPVVLTLTCNDPVENYPPAALEEMRHLIDFGRLAVVCQSAGSLASLKRRDIRVAAVIPPVMEPPPSRRFRANRSAEFVVGFATAPLLRDHWESRGISLLLDLASLSPEIRFILAWRTSPDEIQRAIAAKGLRNITVLAGHLNMEDFYGHVDAMILPFGRETGNHACPLSAVEGMLRGKPVLATEFAGISDWLRREGAGVVVPPAARSLRGGLVRLRSESQEFGRQARSSAMRHFDRATAVNAYTRLYAEILEKHKGPTLREWELRVQGKGKQLARGRTLLAKYYTSQEVANKYTADRFSVPPFQQIDQQGRDGIQKIIQSRFGGRTDLKLLDLSTGTGRLLPSLVPFGATTALDASDAMLRVARERNLPDVRFLKGDVFQHPIEDKFHVITCGRLLRHFEYPDRRVLYRRFCDLLRDDGIAMVDVPNPAVEYEFRDLSGWENFPVYDVFWTLPEFREELRENNLQLVSFVSVAVGLALHPEQRELSQALEFIVAFERAHS